MTMETLSKKANISKKALPVHPLEVSLGYLGVKLEQMLFVKHKRQVMQVTLLSDPQTSKIVKRYYGLMDSEGNYGPQHPFILNEIKAMKSVRHPNIMKLERAVNDPLGNSILLLMSRCSRGSVTDRMKSGMTSKQLAKYFVQTACALRYLHNNEIIHGDVKPCNIFVNDSDDAVLGDFGGAHILTDGETRISTWGGSPGFIAPEFFKPGVEVNAYKVGNF